MVFLLFLLLETSYDSLNTIEIKLKENMLQLFLDMPVSPQTVCQNKNDRRRNIFNTFYFILSLKASQVIYS